MRTIDYTYEHEELDENDNATGLVTIFSLEVSFNVRECCGACDRGYRAETWQEVEDVDCKVIGVQISTPVVEWECRNPPEWQKYFEGIMDEEPDILNSIMEKCYENVPSAEDLTWRDRLEDE